MTRHLLHPGWCSLSLKSSPPTTPSCDIINDTDAQRLVHGHPHSQSFGSICSPSFFCPRVHTCHPPRSLRRAGVLVYHPHRPEALQMPGERMEEAGGWRIVVHDRSLSPRPPPVAASSAFAVIDSPALCCACMCHPCTCLLIHGPGHRWLLPVMLHFPFFSPL